MKTNVKTMIETGAVLRLIVPVNPYREGTLAYRRFEEYRDGATVAKVLANKNVDVPGFRWDLNTLLIDVEPAPATARKTKRTRH